MYIYLKFSAQNLLSNEKSLVVRQNCLRFIWTPCYSSDCNYSSCSIYLLDIFHFTFILFHFSIYMHCACMYIHFLREHTYVQLHLCTHLKAECICRLKVTWRIIFDFSTILLIKARVSQTNPDLQNLASLLS